MRRKKDFQRSFPLHKEFIVDIERFLFLGESYQVDSKSPAQEHPPVLISRRVFKNLDPSIRITVTVFVPNRRTQSTGGVALRRNPENHVLGHPDRLVFDLGHSILRKTSEETNEENEAFHGSSSYWISSAPLSDRPR